MDNNRGGRQATAEEHHEIERRPPSPAREETRHFPIPRPCVSRGKMSQGSRWDYPRIPPEGGFHRGRGPREGSIFFEGEPLPLPGLHPGGQDLLRTCPVPEKHHEIELMKQQLLSSMSQDIEAAPKLSTESAGESSWSSESSDQEKIESSCSIFRVPETIGGGFAEACRPRIVSIGPYHHGEQQLQMLQKHKWSYLRTMQGSRRDYPRIPPVEGFHRGRAPHEGSNFFEGEPLPLPGLVIGGQDLLRTCPGPEEHYEIELMKQQLLSSMSQDIEAAPKLSTESAGGCGCSIFRVPETIGGSFAEACRPRIVSIGPYHHGEQQFQMLQKHKWSYLRTMLDQTQSHGVGLEDLITTVALKVEMIRQCYSESTECFSGPDLVKMMVVDGCFIIQFLRQFVGLRPTNPPLKYSYMGRMVARDLLRLENQVPYFVLEDLFETTNVPRATFSFDYLVSTFFCYLNAIARNCLNRQIVIKGVHLLDSFRRSLIPQGQQDNPVKKGPYRPLIRSASELHRLGIGFKQGQANTILEIKFDKERRTVIIPQIAMNDCLNCILSNMVAFEQCRGQINGHITAYAMFMGCLIHTVDDVQLLRDCKVILNDGMSNQDVACFFSNIYKESAYCVTGMYLKSHFLFLLSEESFKYERASFYRAQLLNAVHDNPWSALSGLAVVVTLVGIIQTVYAVLQYYHPKS